MDCTRGMPGTCICNVTTTESIVFSDVANLPRAAEVRRRLMVGAADPATFGGGEGGYVLCRSAECRAAQLRSGISIHMRNSSAAPASGDTLVLTTDTIFEVASAVAGQRPLFLKNKVGAPATICTCSYA